MKNAEYYGFSGWSGDDYSSVEAQFEAKLGPEPEYVYAVYSTPSYEGSADIVFRLKGDWFHASGGHCSCYGLEGQWAPSPLDPDTFFKAKEAGREYLLPYDSEGDYPEATKEHFAEWFRWATSQP